MVFYSYNMEGWFFKEIKFANKLLHKDYNNCQIHQAHKLMFLRQQLVFLQHTTVQNSRLRYEYV